MLEKDEQKNRILNYGKFRTMRYLKGAFAKDKQKPPLPFFAEESSSKNVSEQSDQAQSVEGRREAGVVGLYKTLKTLF